MTPQTTDVLQACSTSAPYPDPQRPGCWRVPIASRLHRMEAIIDAESLPLVQGKRWNWSPGSGGRTSGGFVVWQGAGTPLARIIMGMTDPKLLVSHVNGDKLDFRRENLIVRTRSEVALAKKPSKKWEGYEPYIDPDQPGVVRVPVCSDKHEGMEALIDASDLPLVQGKRWNWSPGRPDPAKDGSVVIAGRDTPRPSLARILLGIDDPDQLVSHRNGDRLDCRRENLIVRTRSEVKAASGKVMVKGGRMCSSRFKGVSRKEGERKWIASITAVSAAGCQTRHHLGSFRSEIDAALAYDAAANELFGKHAQLNLPDPAEVERLRASEPPYQPLYESFPPPGMVERDDACQMFGVSLTTWVVWERNGRIRCGKFHPLPDDKPGRCKLYPIEELERLRGEFSQLGKPYADPERPGCYRVPLKGYLAYREAIIDAADLPLVEGRNWNWAVRDEGTVDGCVVLATVAGPQTPLARIIAGVSGTDERVSFANGDPLDCRRQNIVVKSLAEQVHGNRKSATRAGRPCTSRFKGVCWSEERGKWVAQIRKDGKYRNLGRFYEEIDAAEAYDEAARELFGEHAWLNFPGEGERGLADAMMKHGLDQSLNPRIAA